MMKKTSKAKYTVTVWDDNNILDYATHDGTLADVAAFAEGYMARFPPRHGRAQVMIGPNRPDADATAVWLARDGAWRLAHGTAPKASAAALARWDGDAFRGWRKGSKRGTWRPTPRPASRLPSESTVMARPAGATTSPANPPSGYVVAGVVAALVGVGYLATR